MITNNRLGGGYRGDTETPEQYIPATGFKDRDWETCMTMNGTWGYKSYDQNWKSTTTLVRNLIDIASKGGNYLLNVGPTAEGLIPEPSVERLEEIGKWMEVYGEAIYGTQASPFPNLGWGRCTRKVAEGITTLYLHVFDWPSDGRLVVRSLPNEVVEARLMGVDRKLTVKREGEGVVVEVPAQAPNVIASVVVLRVRGEVATQPWAVLPEKDGSLILIPDTAETTGQLRCEGRHSDRYLARWTNPADTATWRVDIPHETRYRLEFEAAAKKNSKLMLCIGDRTTEIPIPATGNHETYTVVRVDSVTIPAGRISVVLRAVPTGWSPVNVRALKFRPVR